MKNSVKIAPPYSIVFVADPNGGEPPEPKTGEMILSTPSCISVGCYPEIDGDTEITVGPANEVDPGYAPSFVGTLETPNRAIVVSTAEEEEVLEVPVEATETGLRIWLSHPKWPESVIIGLE